MNAVRTSPSSTHLESRPPLTRDQIRDLLFAPLPELNPPGFRPDQLAGLRALPPFCKRLKLASGLWALEPLADGPPSPILDALTLSAELLAAVGGFLARRNPDEVPLRSLLVAATLTMFHHRPRPDDPRLKESQMLLEPEMLLLEAAELALLRRARSAGTSEEVLGCASLMLVALWQLAGLLRQSPGANPEELIRANGWMSPASEKILCKFAVGCAVGELASDGPGLGLLRAFRSPSARRASWL